MAGSMLYGCGSKEAPAAPDGQAAMSLDSAQEDGDAGKADKDKAASGEVRTVVFWDENAGPNRTPYYEELISAGVQIYEYTPGFVHAKVFVSDDDTATVGTINLDFRSLYLHFECGTFIYNNQVVRDIEKDFQETLKKCQKVTVTDLRNRKVGEKVCGRVLRLIAPLM